MGVVIPKCLGKLYRGHSWRLGNQSWRGERALSSKGMVVIVAYGMRCAGSVVAASGIVSLEIGWGWSGYVALQIWLHLLGLRLGGLILWSASQIYFGDRPHTLGAKSEGVLLWWRDFVRSGDQVLVVMAGLFMRFLWFFEWDKIALGGLFCCLEISVL